MGGLLTGQQGRKEGAPIMLHAPRRDVYSPKAQGIEAFNPKGMGALAESN